MLEPKPDPCEFHPVPVKVSELISRLVKAGFSDRGGKGSHRNFSKGAVNVTVSGKTGADAKH